MGATLRAIDGGGQGERWKRVVVHQRNGTVTIIGAFNPGEHAIHPMITINFSRGPVEAGLLRVTPRQIVYREIMAPPASGRLGEFHPEQR